MGAGPIEFIMVMVIGLFSLGVPIAIVLFAVMIYRKLDRIERLLEERKDRS
jgi:hypothetical protein